MLRPRSFAVVTLLALVLLARPATAETPRRWALLVAVDDYAELTGLECACQDQRDFSAALVKAGFPADQVFLLEDKAKARRLPFRRNILRELELVGRLTEPGDVLIVGFSGHGVTLGGVRYICPADGQLEDAETLINVDGLYKTLATFPATLKLVFLDACRAGDPRPPGRRDASSLRGLTLFNEAPEQRPPQGIWVLSSCGKGQFAMEDKSNLRHGVFMHFVLEGLAGKAAKDDGMITLAGLYDYASLATKKYVFEHWARIQTPALYGDIDGPFELARIEPNPPSVPGTPVKPREVITNSIGMKLTLIPAGEFEMGTSESAGELVRAFPDAKPEYFDHERPAHRVRITQPFYLGTYEVTLGQFLKFYQDAGYKCECEKDGKGGWGLSGDKFEQKPEFSPWSWGFPGQTNDHPVVNVSWNDAVAFCEWLSRKEGKTYRLPTEAEWEYACRAGSQTRYSNGNDPEGLTLVGNVADATAKRRFASWTTTINTDGYELTAPVGSFKPNAFGLYDMHGNVWEWCSDWYGMEYYGQSPGDNPTGPATGSIRVNRGGGFDSPPRVCRSAFRYEYAPTGRVDVLGFRVVSSPGQ